MKFWRQISSHFVTRVCWNYENFPFHSRWRTLYRVLLKCTTFLIVIFIIFDPTEKVNLINQKNAGDLKNVVSERFRMLADQQKNLSQFQNRTLEIWLLKVLGRNGPNVKKTYFLPVNFENLKMSYHGLFNAFLASKPIFLTLRHILNLKKKSFEKSFLKKNYDNLKIFRFFSKNRPKIDK